jgi:hypothetical protein
MPETLNFENRYLRISIIIKHYFQVTGFAQWAFTRYESLNFSRTGKGQNLKVCKTSILKWIEGVVINQTHVIIIGRE